MISDEIYTKILKYFDGQLWDRKYSDTGWNYDGLVLDSYFENSIMSIDYLDIEDYFRSNGGFSYEECELLAEQYGNLPKNKRMLLLQNILNVLNQSKANADQTRTMITRVTNVLRKNNVRVECTDAIELILVANNVIDSGSYCIITRQAEGVLRKELKQEHQGNEKLEKRLKYEYENMQKLNDCPQILKVYSFDIESNSYLMEQADKNLYKHLNDEVDIPVQDKIKIIYDILYGMNCAHERSVIHRDLHLGNVLKIGNDFVISDFGLSKDLSIERSLKSSYTEKNNHMFMDPVAMSDFTKLDAKSDIYSIGKIIDYIFTLGADNPNHILGRIVERCICRDKGLRYDSVAQIINDINSTLAHRGQEEQVKETINSILNNICNVSVQDFIMNLVESGRLSEFIVKHKLINFGQLVMQFESVYQERILNSMLADYSAATGYGGWANYEIFGRIAYQLCLNIQDIEIKILARRLLEECAQIRKEVKVLLDRLPE